MYLELVYLGIVPQGHCISVFCTVLKVNVQQMFCSISFTQPYNDHQEFTLPFFVTLVHVHSSLLMKECTHFHDFSCSHF